MGLSVSIFPIPGDGKFLRLLDRAYAESPEEAENKEKCGEFVFYRDHSVTNRN
jgi:hypothetical protein